MYICGTDEILPGKGGTTSMIRALKGNHYMNSKKRVDIMLEIAMIILAMLMAIPIYYLVVTTFKTPAEAVASPLGLPNKINFDLYIDAWKAMNYPSAFKKIILL